jgi:hypothetical protein
MLCPPAGVTTKFGLELAVTCFTKDVLGVLFAFGPAFFDGLGQLPVEEAGAEDT